MNKPDNKVTLDNLPVIALNTSHLRRRTEAFGVVFGCEEKLIVVLPVGADLAVLDVESSELMQCCRYA